MLIVESSLVRVATTAALLMATNALRCIQPRIKTSSRSAIDPFLPAVLQPSRGVGPRYRSLVCFFPSANSSPIQPIPSLPLIHTRSLRFLLIGLPCFLLSSSSSSLPLLSRMRIVPDGQSVRYFGTVCFGRVDRYILKLQCRAAASSSMRRSSGLEMQAAAREA